MLHMNIQATQSGELRIVHWLYDQFFKIVYGFDYVLVW